MRLRDGVFLARGERCDCGGSIVCVFDSCMIVRMDTNVCVVHSCGGNGKSIISQIVITANSSAALNLFSFHVVSLQLSCTFYRSSQ